MASQQPTGVTPQPSNLADLSRDDLLDLLRACAQVKSESAPDLSKNFQIATAAISLLGLGLYGAVRFGQQLFYNRLRLTPEEVGLSYAAAVSRAAVIIIALLMTLILATSTIGIGEYLPNRRGCLGSVAGYLLGIAGGGAAVFISVIALGDIGWFIGAGICFGSIAAFVALQALRARGVSLQTLRDRPAFPLAIISMITILAFVLSGVTALRSASKVNEGKELFGPGAYGILGLRSEPVTVTGQLPTGFSAPKDIVYLGRSDGMIVLYDYSEDEPIRIPSDGVVVLHR
jgi:hypothetical protein